MSRLRRLLVCGAFVAIWFTFLAPSGMGGPVGLIWVSGTSMEPGLHTGDLVVVYERDDYAVGDVVAFEIPGGGTVIHRIIEVTTDGYRFQGDNRDFADPWLLTDDDIVGSAVVDVPNAADVLSFLGRPLVLAILAAVTILLWYLRPDDHADEPGSEPGVASPRGRTAHPDTDVPNDAAAPTASDRLEVARDGS